MGIVFTEKPDRSVEVGFRSIPGVDVSQTAFRLGGGGMPRRQVARSAAPWMRSLPRCWRHWRHHFPGSGPRSGLSGMPSQLPQGMLNLDEPRSWTSHDVVAQVRRLIGVKRVGHAGTLDPLATGVLLVCVGQATRVSEYLMRSRKRYRATLHLGIETDTHDADGSEVSRQDTVKVTRAAFEEALVPLRGSIEQKPPMYSALKRNGQPLHRLARRGELIDLEARPVHIFDLRVARWDDTMPVLDVVCSPGTYVRALARDLGRSLGCGAHIASLVRTASGQFGVGNSRPYLTSSKLWQKKGGASLCTLSTLHLMIFNCWDYPKIRSQGSGTGSPSGMNPVCRPNSHEPIQQMDSSWPLSPSNSTTALWRPKKVFSAA